MPAQSFAFDEGAHVTQTSATSAEGFTDAKSQGQTHVDTFGSAVDDAVGTFMSQNTANNQQILEHIDKLHSSVSSASGWNDSNKDAILTACSDWKTQLNTMAQEDDQAVQELKSHLAKVRTQLQEHHQRKGQILDDASARSTDAGQKVQKVSQAYQDIDKMVRPA